MKPPDRLLSDASVLRSMAKFWIGLPVALTLLLWTTSSSQHEYHLWGAIAGAFRAITQAALALLIIVVGGKLLVSLLQIARNNPDRIILAMPWLFESKQVHKPQESSSPHP